MPKDAKPAATTPRTPRHSGDERRGQVVRAALTLAEQGLSAVTIAALAKAVGVVPSAIYRHFDGRDDVIRAAFEHVRGLMGRNLRRAATEPRALAGLEDFLRRHLALIDRHRALPRMLFSEQATAMDSVLRQAIVAGQDAMLTGIAAIIARGQAEGEIRRDAEPRDLAVLFLSQMLLPAHMRYIRGGDFDMTGQVERNWRIFRQMLSPAAETWEAPA
ncbi:MAG: TetR/AcrR family transcriptional regulator [Desulfovibrionaceae bacterium]